jgi:putative YphP/YqiW family bacilliredoxin
MPYPEELVTPMREDLTVAGFQELKSAEDVNQAFENKEGTALIVVNSVCGCAAAMARPGVKLSLQMSDKKPDRLLTVFAGQDLDATAEARKHMFPYPPSSPSIALYKDGKLVHFIERHHIEGRPAQMIAANLKAAYEAYCGETVNQ